MRMKQGLGLGSLGDFGDGVTERGERVKGRGFILLSCARHVRAGAGKLDQSDFFNFRADFFLAFGPVRVNLTHFSIPGIFYHFLRMFRHYFEIIQNLQNKIKSNETLKIRLKRV